MHLVKIKACQFPSLVLRETENTGYVALNLTQETELDAKGWEGALSAEKTGWTGERPRWQREEENQEAVRRKSKCSGACLTLQSRIQK